MKVITNYIFNIFYNKIKKNCKINQCYICFNDCILPANIPLECNCKYNVHYDCIYIWYGFQQKCIICKKYFKPPWPHIIEDYLYTITEILKIIYLPVIFLIFYLKN